MTARTFPLALLLLAAAAAGCAGGDRAGTPDAPDAEAVRVPPVPEFDFRTVVDPDHAGHSLPELHTAGHGLRQVGHASVQDLLPLGVRGSITQVDVQGDLAVVSGMQGGLAFVVADVSDPARPTPLGWYPSAADGWTARLSDDGRYVFYGCQVLGALGDPVGQVRGTCEEPAALRAPASDNPSGIVAVDVGDPRQPRFVDFLPAEGSHNIQVATIDGTDYVFTSSVAILAFDREAGKLRQVAEVPGRHDVTVARHPTTEVPYLFTGTGELAVWDVRDPARPVQVFEGQGDEGWRGWHDQVLVPGLLEGRWIALLAGESLAAVATPADESGLPDALFVVDVTDPGSPELLGTWKPPYDPQLPWVGYQYSIHEMAATRHGQVAIAWYHAGVWVVDVGTRERQAAPLTLAAFQPHMPMTAMPPSTFAQTPVPYVPFVWGAAWHHSGHLVVPDMHTGLYVLEPEWGLWPTEHGGQ
ncbi:MAG TPA: hypothetical protein VFH47_04880 [Candidatus Thermoplasmatota archaeon]|nr:hypothetical protein [Candidatus Thermoplasmatota archaeon]